MHAMSSCRLSPRGDLNPCLKINLCRIRLKSSTSSGVAAEASRSCRAHHVEEHGVPDIHDVVAEVAAVGRLVVKAATAKAAVVAIIARQAQIKNRQNADFGARLAACRVQVRPYPVAVPATQPWPHFARVLRSVGTCQMVCTSSQTVARQLAAQCCRVIGSK